MKNSPAAQSRFIYWNNSIQSLPKSFTNFALNPPPILKGFLSSLIREPWKSPSSKVLGLKDESIRDFMIRRFNVRVADDLISAVTRGIFAGDTSKLSIRSCFPSIWNAERNHGSLIKGLVSESFTSKETPSIFKESSLKFISSMSDSGIYTFQGGLSTLSNALFSKCQEFSNVQIRQGIGCTEISDKKVHSPPFKFFLSSDSFS